MLTVIGTLKSVSPRRGRGPAVLCIESDIDVAIQQESESIIELTTFDGAVLREAAQNIGAKVSVEYEEKKSKDGEKVYRNLSSMKILEAPQKSQEALESTSAFNDRAREPVKAELVVVRQPEAPDAMSRLEMGFKLAVRQRELLEEFIRGRFKEGEHFMDGATFGSKKRVLLQPGAQLIHYAHGHVVDYEWISGAKEAQKPETPYTIVLKALVKNRAGELLGTGLGSCSSLIWSNRDARFKDRAQDPDKVHNTTLKMAKKRALVDSCLNTTAAAEYFTQDLEDQ